LTPLPRRFTLVMKAMMEPSNRRSRSTESHLGLLKNPGWEGDLRNLWRPSRAPGRTVWPRPQPKPGRSAPVTGPCKVRSG